MSEDSGWSSLDEVDQKIIAILNKNARAPSKEIASELRTSGVDVSDRTIRKRIERLEKSGIIKGYKAVLSGISITDEFEVLFLKLKIARSINTQVESIREFAKAFSNYLFVATVDGDWNMLIVMRQDSEKNPTSKIIEKFSDQISDYRISGIHIKDVNLLNMSLVLLT
ncbi:MAG: Lrp/AsnC family transcriptional regulator [Nitrosotalea sp.]